MFERVPYIGVGSLYRATLYIREPLFTGDAGTRMLGSPYIEVQVYKLTLIYGTP